MEKKDDLVEELMQIHRRCKAMIIARDHDGFNEYVIKYIEEEDGIPKLNKLKTILVISKNVPDFFPEVAESINRVRVDYDRLSPIIAKQENYKQ